MYFIQNTLQLRLQWTEDFNLETILVWSIDNEAVETSRNAEIRYVIFDMHEPYSFFLQHISL